MDNLSEMRAAVRSDLTVGTESTLFDETAIDLAINRAYRKIGVMYRWPELEDAKKTSSVSGQNYYDYPDEWQPDSIWMLQVSGERYGEKPDGSPLAFKDWLIFKEDEPNSSVKKWSSQNRRFFISPTPTANGNNDICVWGQKTITALTTGTSVTIFSYSMPECNEAIVLEAVAILKGKGGDESSQQFKSMEALRIVTTAWNKVRQNQQKYEKVQPIFSVPDFYGKPQSNDTIGNFDY